MDCGDAIPSTSNVNVRSTPQTGPARDMDFTVADVDSFIKSKKKRNTVVATKRDVSNVERWLIGKSEHRPLELIEPDELDGYLSCFFLSVRKADGSEYEPASLTAMLYSCDRYLQEHSYGYSVLKDKQFTKTQQALRAKRIDLRQQGKGNKPKAAKPISDSDEDLMIEKNVFGTHSPFSVTFSLWYAMSVCMGMRGRDEHRKLRFGDINIATDVRGKEFLTMTERDTKTRDGGKADDNRDTKAKLMCVCESRSPQFCPVEQLKTFAEHRPQESRQNDSPFYLTMKRNFDPQSEQIWFYASPMGVNTLGSLLPTACEMAGIERKTNHGARKTCIKRLRKENVPAHKIIQITGHKNTKSIESYDNELSDSEHEEYLSILQRSSTKSATKVRVLEPNPGPKNVPSETVTSVNSHGSGGIVMNNCNITFNFSFRSANNTAVNDIDINLSQD